MFQAVALLISMQPWLRPSDFLWSSVHVIAIKLQVYVSAWSTNTLIFGQIWWRLLWRRHFFIKLTLNRWIVFFQCCYGTWGLTYSRNTTYHWSTHPKYVSSDSNNIIPHEVGRPYPISRMPRLLSEQEFNSRQFLHLGCNPTFWYCPPAQQGPISLITIFDISFKLLCIYLLIYLLIVFM